MVMLEGDLTALFGWLDKGAGTPSASRIERAGRQVIGRIDSAVDAVIAGGGNRQVVIGMREIMKQVAPGMNMNRRIWYSEGFGERSGTLLFRMYSVALVQLNLDRKKVILLTCFAAAAIGTRRVTSAW
ncbi:hypothetical protein ACP70R_025541 [Stipagrostis hirtigluma subsp. patula]